MKNVIYSQQLFLACLLCLNAACEPAMVPYQKTDIPVASSENSTKRSHVDGVQASATIHQEQIQQGTPYLDLKITGKPDDLYAATIRVFLRRGTGLHSRDPIAKVVETNWLVIKAARPFVRGLEASFRVMISTNRLEIYTSCQITTMDRLTNRSCPSNERPKEIVDIEQDLVRAIQSEAASL